MLATSVYETKFVRFAHADSNAVPKQWNKYWDGRGSQAGSGTRHIILIRHGQYHMKTSKSPDRRKEQVLTSLGILQAEKVGQYLTKLTENLEIPVTKIVASTMTRAMQTCAIATANMSLTNLPLVELSGELVEFDPYTYFPLFCEEFSLDRLESILDDRTKFNNGFDKFMFRSTEPSSSLELYFLHSNVIRALVLKALQLPINSFTDCEHCSVNHIEIKPNGVVVCHSMSDTGFLTVDNVTSSNENTRAPQDMLERARSQINHMSLL